MGEGILIISELEKKLISFFINKWDFQLAKSLLEV